MTMFNVLRDKISWIWEPALFSVALVQNSMANCHNSLACVWLLHTRMFDGHVSYKSSLLSRVLLLFSSLCLRLCLFTNHSFNSKIDDCCLQFTFQQISFEDLDTINLDRSPMPDNFL